MITALEEAGTGAREGGIPIGAVLLALAGLIGFALLNEQEAAAVIPALNVGPDEGGGFQAAQAAVPQHQRLGDVHHAPAMAIPWATGPLLGWPRLRPPARHTAAPVVQSWRERFAQRRLYAI